MQETRPTVYNRAMSLSALLAQYGLVAVFAGTLFEGETLLLLAGYAAHRGYLDLTAVVAVAWAGAVLGDQFWFWLGRCHGTRLLARRPALAARVARALALIERHPDGAVFAMRFAWGLRIALPVALGTSRVSWRRYTLLNALSALLWAPLVAGTGYFFGAALARHPDMLTRYEHWGMAAVLAGAVGVHFALKWRQRQR